MLEGPADPKWFRKILLYRWWSVMVSIALLLFRPNPDFVLLLPVVEPGRPDSFPCPPASHFVSFFFCIVAWMKTPDRPDFPECPPPALLFSGSGFFASFQSSSWSTGKKEMNECSFGKMYNNTPTETKAKGESRRWTYRTEIRSQIEILIHWFTIIINRVNGDSAVGRAVSFLLDRGGFHSPTKTKSALRTVLDSHPSHGSQT